MKRISILLLTILFTVSCTSVLAAKARSISSEADSAYHAEHLKRHIGESSCFATGNYIKAYIKIPAESGKAPSPGEFCKVIPEGLFRDGVIASPASLC